MRDLRLPSLAANMPSLSGQCVYRLSAKHVRGSMMHFTTATKHPAFEKFPGSRAVICNEVGRT